jgi:CDP-diacylglycerol--glycerol-3-phosphate 3-phosphatidyltransferase
MFCKQSDKAVIFGYYHHDFFFSLTTCPPMWNLPNLLTLFRILLIPFFVLTFYLPIPHHHFITAAIFALACLTDWLDGYLARVLKQLSSLGAFLDPVADKLIVAVALVLLVSEDSLNYLAIPAAIIICREIVVSALREWMAELGKRSSVAVSVMGKVKTTIQMLALIVLLSYQPSLSPNWLLVLGYLLLYAAAGLTLWSMLLYLRSASADLRK